MAYRFRLIFSLFLVFYSSVSFSAISPTSRYYYWVDAPDILSSESFDTGQAACQAYLNVFKAGAVMSFYQEMKTTYNPRCYWNNNKNYDYLVRRVACPSNSSLNNNVCVCSAEYEEKNGQCVDLNYVEPPDLCESLVEACETLSGSKKWITGLRRDVSYKPFKTCTPAGLVPGCNKGCVINSSGNGVFYKDQLGDYYFEGEGVISSETCFPTSEGSGEPPKEEDNPLPPSEPPEKPCNPGEYQYAVNGTKVCLPAKSKETIIKEETINNNDNSTTNINTTVKCENGKCTISETTTDKDSSGATTGESTKETQVSQSDFCAQNPGSSVCKSPGLGREEGEGEDDKKSSFSGSCSSSFSCEGDSVQCAIALEQHKTACKLFDESNTYFQAFKDAEASNSDGVESSTVDLASHVSVDSVIGSGACPADIEVTVFNQSIPVELSKFCQYFDAMGMLIMLGACIGCLRILGSG